MNFIEEPRNREYLILGTLLLLGFITRFLFIDHQSIWIDEGSTFYYSHFTWDQFKTANEPNSPVYYMMEGVFIDMLGQSEFGLRFSSAVAGALTTPLAYLISMKLFNSRPMALITASLFLLSPMCLFYGQEARGYMLVLLIFMIQLYVLLYALERRNNLLWLLFAILSAIQFCMQFSGVLATFTLYVYAAHRCLRTEDPEEEKRTFFQILWSGVLFLILSIPLMKFAYDTMVISSGHERWGWCYVGFEYLINSINDLLFGVIISAILFILVIIGMYLCYKDRKEHFVLLCLIILIPLIFSTQLSLWMNMTPRYILWAVVGLYLAIPCVLLRIDENVLISKKAAIAGIAIFAILAVCVLPSYYTDITKEDFRTGADVLSENAKPGDIILYSVGSENSVYASIKFYYDPVKEGIETRGVSSVDELLAVTETGSYDNIYILILSDYDPLDYLENLQSDNCEKISNPYRINIFRITGPLQS